MNMWTIHLGEKLILYEYLRSASFCHILIHKHTLQATGETRLNKKWYNNHLARERRAHGASTSHLNRNIWIVSTRAADRGLLRKRWANTVSTRAASIGQPRNNADSDSYIIHALGTDLSVSRAMQRMCCTWLTTWMIKLLLSCISCKTAQVTFLLTVL